MVGGNFLCGAAAREQAVASRAEQAARAMDARDRATAGLPPLAPSEAEQFRFPMEEPLLWYALSWCVRAATGGIPGGTEGPGGVPWVGGLPPSEHAGLGALVQWLLRARGKHGWRARQRAAAALAER